MTRIDEALRRARRIDDADHGHESLVLPGEPLTFDPASFAVEDPRSARQEVDQRRRERTTAGVDLSIFTRIVPSQPVNGNGGLQMQRLITQIGDDDPTLDQFRSIAATLHHAQLDRPLHTLTVTSAASGEGKTLVSANLALTLSRSYNRHVLLIDADLRRPGLHEYFPVPRDAGLPAALAAMGDGSAVAVHEITPRLALLQAGRSTRDPVSLFSTDAMHRLVAAAASAFDWVIVDAPPVGMLPDANLLSGLTDAVLLVVQAGRVRYDLVQRTVESLGADRIFGVVLNKVPERDLVSSFGRDYYNPYK